MRRTGYLFSEICHPDNFKLAWLKAARGKASKPDFLTFHRDSERRLEELRRSVEDERFRFGDYRYFSIYDPKERLICAAPLSERIVHHAFMNILDPIFERYQINDSYACRRGKGTQAAVLRAFHFAKTNRYFLKMDVRKYFLTIDHDILKRSLRRKLKDPRVLNALDAIIDSYHSAPGKGLPIGNLTSQYFANDYLGICDHFAVEGMGAGPYVRYMDDVIVFGDDKAGLKLLYKVISDFCANDLALTLKPPVIDTVAAGTPFLGFLIKPYGVFLSDRTKRRFTANARRIDYLYIHGCLDESVAGDRITAMIAHIQLARARGFRYHCFYGRRLGNEPRDPRRVMAVWRI